MSGTILTTELGIAHEDGTNVLWCRRGGLRLHPRFEPPLCSLERPLIVGGRPTRGFGLWSTTNDDQDWAQRRQEVRIHRPLLAEAEEMQERFGEIDAARREDAGEELTADEPRFRPFPGFVAELRPARGGRLLVASVPRQTSLTDTLALAMRGLRPFEETDCLERGERIRIPCIRAAFGSELAFELDEGGESEPSQPASTGLCLPPRDLLCRLPFLVVLLDGSEPELVLWIENDELLVPAPEP